MRIRKYDLAAMQKQIDKPRKRDFPETQMINQGDIREMLRRKKVSAGKRRKPS